MFFRLIVTAFPQSDTVANYAAAFIGVFGDGSFMPIDSWTNRNFGALLFRLMFVLENTREALLEKQEEWSDVRFQVLDGKKDIVGDSDHMRDLSKFEIQTLEEILTESSLSSTKEET